ncbi:MAG: NTPase [Chitinophagaceae bacterium]|nr:NTPase [Chitinophagaceae bacterium]
MWSDNETSEDLLGFKVHADLLIDVIKDENVLPVTIGIFGDWGSGKSSVLKIINDELAGEDGDLKDNTLVLYFNGWVFEGYDDAKAALLESIIEKFEKHKTIGHKVKDSTVKLFKSVKWMRMLGLGFKKIVLPTAAAYFTGGLSLIPFLSQEFGKIDKKDLADKLSGDKAEAFLKEIIEKKEEEKTSLVREFREDFAEMIAKSNIDKLVVIIDDLDRCTYERIIENLEAIKLFLNVEKTAFFIGADPRIVRHAIEYRYKRESKPDEDANERIIDDYLEKLIQIPYFLPKLSEPEVETYLTMLICKKELPATEFEKVLGGFQKYKLNDRYSSYGISNLQSLVSEEQLELVKKNVISIPALVPLIAQSLYGNPRQIKRFLNTYTLRKRLANVAGLKDFNDTILAKLMILEYTELNIFKKLFEWQSSQGGQPTQMGDLEALCNEKNFGEVKSDFEDKGYKDWYKEKVVRWLNAEPKLKDVDLRDYFWISRDKILTSIAGSSLIPPVVKAIYRELENEMPATVSKKIIKDKVSILAEHEITALFELIGSMLKKNQKTKRFYELFHFMIDEGIPGTAVYYKEVLRTLSATEIEPGVAVAMKHYEAIEDLGPFLKDYFKGNASAGAKAFNLKNK